MIIELLRNLLPILIDSSASFVNYVVVLDTNDEKNARRRSVCRRPPKIENICFCN